MSVLEMIPYRCQSRGGAELRIPKEMQGGEGHQDNTSREDPLLLIEQPLVETSLGFCSYSVFFTFYKDANHS